MDNYYVIIFSMSRKIFDFAVYNFEIVFEVKN